MNIDTARWKLELEALEANKRYCIARALVFLHDGNDELRLKYLLMANDTDKHMIEIRTHLESSGGR